MFHTNTSVKFNACLQAQGQSNITSTTALVLKLLSSKVMYRYVVSFVITMDRYVVLYVVFRVCACRSS